MNGPYLVLDLKPHWPMFEQLYVTTPTRLIGPFHDYLLIIVDLFKVTHNDTSEDEVLLDNYINGSYLELSEPQQMTARHAVQTGLDAVITLAHIWTEFPGQVRACTLDMTSRTLMIEFGGDCGQA